MDTKLKTYIYKYYREEHKNIFLLFPETRLLKASNKKEALEKIMKFYKCENYEFKGYPASLDDSKFFEIYFINTCHEKFPSTFVIHLHEINDDDKDFEKITDYFANTVELLREI